MHTAECVRRLSALAQETRLNTVKFLSRVGPEGCPTGAITRQLGVRPSTMSNHLRLLLQAGLITQKRIGRQLIYKVSPATVHEVLTCLTTDFHERVN
jgi:ArsR family transcriptional regulator, arsenate/arsenite/antimonite-responsive transcriptional repressor